MSNELKECPLCKKKAQEFKDGAVVQCSDQYDCPMSTMWRGFTREQWQALPRKEERVFKLMLAALKAVEWERGTGWCPCCSEAARPGHASYCKIGIAIKAAEDSDE